MKTTWSFRCKQRLSYSAALLHVKFSKTKQEWTLLIGQKKSPRLERLLRRILEQLDLHETALRWQLHWFANHQLVDLSSKMSEGELFFFFKLLCRYVKVYSKFCFILWYEISRKTLDLLPMFCVVSTHIVVPYIRDCVSWSTWLHWQRKFRISKFRITISNSMCYSHIIYF